MPAPRAVLVLSLVLCVSAASCSLARDAGLAPTEPDRTALAGPLPEDEAAHVVVQHVLISFDGADIPRDAGVTRGKADAQRLAQRVLAEARSGREFADLVRLYSDERSGNGTYEIANWGVTPGANERERRGLVRGFGDAAFRLAPGDVTLVEYDPSVSPFGWHVIKRLR